METKQHATKNQWINNKIKEEIKKNIEINNNENITIQNLWDAIKAILRGKFTEIQTFLKKQEKSQFFKNYFLPKVSRRKEIIKDQRGNKIRDLKTAEKSGKPRPGF